jgi:hypothetical protein
VSDEQELEELVETYLQASAAGEKDALERLAAVYPAHEHELTRMALLLASVPGDPGERDLQAASNLLSGTARTRALAAARAAIARPLPGERTPEVEVLPGLISRAQELGLQVRSLAAAVDLPRDVVLELDRRTITPASVPGRLLGALANTLRTNVESVRAYLAGSAPQQAVAFYYAPTAPEPPVQRSFAQALAESALISPEQQASWEAALREDGLL